MIKPVQPHIAPSEEEMSSLRSLAISEPPPRTRYDSSYRAERQHTGTRKLTSSCSTLDRRAYRHDSRLRGVGMPFVKPIYGHTELGAVQRFLEKGMHAHEGLPNLNAPMVGIDTDDLPERRDYDCTSVMDEAREILGNNSPFKGRSARTYKR